MTDADLALALKLQAQYDEEDASSSNQVQIIQPAAGRNNHSDRPLSLVDVQWELIDPNPDIHALFIEFNQKYFWGRLTGVEVRWSPRMTLCAGLCVYEGRGGLCSVRLSTPLLKLRPRKDLIETLLHEMIHAYLFVTDNNKDHDGHGPEFHKHMYRLNKETGTNISVYHNFHDEVGHYKQHWWKCDGPCQNRPPYFGLVKRAMNRAPAPRDPWWPDHQRSCGGTYHKIKEPEGYGEKKKSKKEGDKKEEKKVKDNIKGMKDIRDIFKNKSFNNNSKKGDKTNSSGNEDRSKKTPIATISSFNNVDSDSDSGEVMESGENRERTSFPGSGFSLGSSNAASNGIVRKIPGFGVIPVRSNSNGGNSSQTREDLPKLPSFSTVISDSDSDIDVKSKDLSVATWNANLSSAVTLISDTDSDSDSQSMFSSRKSEIQENSTKTNFIRTSLDKAKKSNPKEENLSPLQKFEKHGLVDSAPGTSKTIPGFRSVSSKKWSTGSLAADRNKRAVEISDSESDEEPFERQPIRNKTLNGSQGNAKKRTSDENLGAQNKKQKFDGCDRDGQENNGAMRSDNSMQDRNQTTRNDGGEGPVYHNCPVCQVSVLASAINEHLDNCLM